MKFGLYLSLVVSTVVLSACASPKPGTPEAAAQQEKEMREQAAKAAKSTVDEAPKWFAQPPVDATAIFATGTANSSDMQMAMDRAMLTAKRELANQLNARLSSKMKEFVNEVGGANDAQLNRQVEIATQNVVTDVNLAGFRREDAKVVAQGPQFRAYVLLRYPLGDANRILLNQVKKNSQIESKVRASKAFQELEKEIAEARKSQ